MTAMDADELLVVLAEEALPERLDLIEEDVFTRFRRKLEAKAARRSLVMAGVIAALIGGGSTMASRSPAYAASPPFGVPVDAPSNLLIH
jgi:hypothetical protein